MNDVLWKEGNQKKSKFLKSEWLWGSEGQKMFRGTFMYSFMFQQDSCCIHAVSLSCFHPVGIYSMTHFFLIHITLSVCSPMVSFVWPKNIYCTLVQKTPFLVFLGVFQCHNYQLWPVWAPKQQGSFGYPSPKLKKSCKWENAAKHRTSSRCTEQSCNESAHLVL